MEPTLIAIYLALQIAPYVALLIAFPYTVYQYVKTKSINVDKCTYIYIFILYLLCAYFMTILPLPAADAAVWKKPVIELIQLIPFKGFADIKRESFVHDIALILFNVVLTVPLGYFLRVMFNCNLKKVALLGFLTSLLYEITQLTGLFFIYPRPWRVFDVDDLMVNTLGSVLGYMVAPVFEKILPNHSGEKENRLVQGSEVAFIQRAIAASIDFLIILMITIFIITGIPALHKILTQGHLLQRFPFFYLLIMSVMILYTALFKSRTIGYRITGLQLMTSTSKPVSRLQSIRRMCLLYTGVISIPFWILFFISIYTEYAGIQSIVWMLCATVLMFFAAHNVLEMMFNSITHGSSMFYDRIVKTHLSYNYSKKKSIFGICVIDIQQLERKNVDSISDKVAESLSKEGISQKAVTKVRLMAEGVMLDWIESGLKDTLCELRMDSRFKRKSLILSVAGEDKTKINIADTYVEMLAKLNLKLETYYAGGKNICIIYIP